MGLTKDLGALPRVITVSGSNVGVSVTNPSVQFNVGHASHGLGMAYLGATSLPASAGLFTDSGINGGQGFGSLQIKSRTDFSGYSINFFTALTANVPVERMRIASNGNIGVGTTNPIYNVDVNGGSTTPYLRVYRDTGYVMLWAGLNFSAIYSRNNSDVARNFIIEAANVGIGTESPNSYLAGTVGLVNFHATSPALSIANNSTYWLNYLAGTEYRFFNPTNSVVHTIFLNGNYSFLGTNVSDIRLKEDINKLEINGVESIGSLKPKTYFMKDNKNRKHYGFIAQEVYETIPD